MTFDAIDELRAFLRKGMRVFEYGSGGSSLFWLAFGAELVSIEHDPEWHAILADRLRGLPGVDYRLILPAPIGPAEAAGDPADPQAYRSTDERVLQHAFQTYATAIDAFPEGTFDVVAIDGRARPSCIMHAIPRVKKGGLLVLDNAERGYYLEKTSGFLNGFDKREYKGCGPCNFHFWQTNIYRRIR